MRLAKNIRLEEVQTSDVRDGSMRDQNGPFELLNEALNHFGKMKYLIAFEWTRVRKRKTI